MSAGLLERLRRGDNLRDLNIIDVHGHIGRINFTIPNIGLDALVAGMDRSGVTRVIVSHMRCMSGDCAWGNAEVLKAMREYSGRILGYLSFWPSDAQAVAAEVEKYRSAGFTGLKLHDANGFAYDNPAYEPAYEYANARRLPVLFHTWGGENEFKQIRAISRKYPELSLLLTHVGSMNEAGYIQIARDCANVHLELALSRSPRGLVARLVEALGADNVIWGSDVYFMDQASQLGKVAAACISEEDKLKILSGNARKILDRIQPG